MPDHLNSGKLPILAGTATVLTIFAVILGIFSAGDNVLGWDLSFAVWIQEWQGATGESLYRIGDWLGTTSIAAAVTLIALVIALFRKHIQISIFLVLVLVLRLAGMQLKPLFDSPRPTADHLRLLETFEGTGYPSGHSMTVAMVASMFSLIAWRYMANSRIRWAVTVLAGAAVLLVGWSRIWSGAHWPSDVLGGWSFGIALTIVAWIASDAIASNWAIRKSKPAPSATSPQAPTQ